MLEQLLHIKRGNVAYAATPDRYWKRLDPGEHDRADPERSRRARLSAGEGNEANSPFEVQTLAVVSIFSPFSPTNRLQAQRASAGVRIRAQVKAAVRLFAVLESLGTYNHSLDCACGHHCQAISVLYAKTRCQASREAATEIRSLHLFCCCSCWRLVHCFSRARCGLHDWMLGET